MCKSESLSSNMEGGCVVIVEETPTSSTPVTTSAISCWMSESSSVGVASSAAVASFSAIKGASTSVDDATNSCFPGMASVVAAAHC